MEITYLTKKKKENNSMSDFGSKLVEAKSLINFKDNKPIWLKN